MQRVLVLVLLTSLMLIQSAIAQEETNRIPVDDATFAEIAEHYEYDRSMPLEARVIGVWPHRLPYVIEKVSYQSIHGERVPAYFAHPKDTTGIRYPAVLLLHGANDFWGKNEDWAMDWLDILARSDRCVLSADFFGFGERKRGDEIALSEAGPYTKRDVVIQAVTDQRRGIDYLLSMSLTMNAFQKGHYIFTEI